MALEEPPPMIRSPLWPGVQAVGPFCSVQGTDLILDETLRQPRDANFRMIEADVFETPRKLAQYTARMQRQLQALGLLGSDCRYGSMDPSTMRAVNNVLSTPNDDVEQVRWILGSTTPPPPLGDPAVWDALAQSRVGRDRTRLCGYLGEVDLRYFAELRRPRRRPVSVNGPSVGQQHAATPDAGWSHPLTLQADPVGVGVYEQLRDHNNLANVIRIMQTQLVDMGRLRSGYRAGSIDQPTANALARFMPVDFMHRHWDGFTAMWPDFAHLLGDRPVTLEMLTADLARLRDMPAHGDPKRNYLMGGFADLVDQSYRIAHGLAATPTKPEDYAKSDATVEGDPSMPAATPGQPPRRARRRVRAPTSRLATMARDIASSMAAMMMPLPQYGGEGDGSMPPDGSVEPGDDYREFDAPDASAPGGK